MLSTIIAAADATRFTTPRATFDYFGHAFRRPPVFPAAALSEIIAIAAMFCRLIF